MRLETVQPQSPQPAHLENLSSITYCCASLPIALYLAACNGGSAALCQLQRSAELTWRAARRAGRWQAPPTRCCCMGSSPHLLQQQVGSAVVSLQFHHIQRHCEGRSSGQLLRDRLPVGWPWRRHPSQFMCCSFCTQSETVAGQIRLWDSIRLPDPAHACGHRD